MYRSNADFVFTVRRDFVKSCQTPVLILPDDVPAHPYAVALESAHLAPNTQVSIYPRKANPEQIQLALRHVRAFLKANRPADAAEARPRNNRPGPRGLTTARGTRFGCGAFTSRALRRSFFMFGGESDANIV